MNYLYLWRPVVHSLLSSQESSKEALPAAIFLFIGPFIGGETPKPPFLVSKAGIFGGPAPVNQATFLLVGVGRVLLVGWCGTGLLLGARPPNPSGSLY